MFEECQKLHIAGERRGMQNVTFVGESGKVEFPRGSPPSMILF